MPAAGSAKPREPPAPGEPYEAALPKGSWFDAAREVASAPKRATVGARVDAVDPLAVVRHGIEHAEAGFLQKPFEVNDLLAKVRHVLDRIGG